MRAEVPRGLGSSKLDSSHHCGQLEPEDRRDVRGERSVFYIPWDARSFWVYHLSCIGDSWVLLFVLLVRHRVALVSEICVTQQAGEWLYRCYATFGCYFWVLP